MGGLISEKQRFNMEREILYYLNVSLENMDFRTPKELKMILLNPELIGEVIMRESYKGAGKEFFMGISYLPLRKRPDVDGSDIEGVILDRMGIGFIKGIESHVDGFKGLKFVRKNIVCAGVSKEEELQYDCSVPEKNSKIYEGTIAPFRLGTFKLYPKADSKFLIHNDMQEYFDMFVRGPQTNFHGEPSPESIISKNAHY